MAQGEDSKHDGAQSYDKVHTREVEMGAHKGESKGKGGGSSLAQWCLIVLGLLIAIAALVVAVIAYVDDDTGSSSSSSSSSSSPSSGPRDMGTAVQMGVRSFQEETVLCREKVLVLQEVIRAGDLDMAHEAYAASRASYEQIEVLAASFPEIDCAIDCRPYAYDHGDFSPEFVGFHRIEGHLFRDNDTAAALPFAEGLLALVDDLMVRLEEPEFFDEVNTWAGMLGLATEVVAKKMSGEEEAYNRLSLLIFYNNFLGIESQYMPFDAILKDKDATAAQEVREALMEAKSTVAEFGDVTGGSLGYGVWANYFDLNNFDFKVIYDVAVRVVDALTAAKEILEIGDPEEEAEEPAAEVVVPEGFDSEVEEAVASLVTLADGMEASVAALRGAIASGDLAAARIAYETSRFEYEQIEVLALAFEAVDSDIDARPYAFPLGEADEGFKGFHKIERLLFRDYDLEAALTYADGLVQSTADLQAALADLSNFDVVKIFEGLIGLSLEVGAKKISSEEESVSDLSVLIFEMNFEGVYLVYTPFADRVSNEAAADVDTAYNACSSVVADIQSAGYPPAFTGSSYASFRALPLFELERVITCTYSLAEALVEAAHSISVFADETNPFHRNTYAFRIQG